MSLRLRVMDVSHLEHGCLQEEAKEAEHDAIDDGGGEGVEAGEGAVESHLVERARVDLRGEEPFILGGLAQELEHDEAGRFAGQLRST